MFEKYNQTPSNKSKVTTYKKLNYYCSVYAAHNKALH